MRWLCLSYHLLKCQFWKYELCSDSHLRILYRTVLLHMLGCTYSAAANYKCDSNAIVVTHTIVAIMHVRQYQLYSDKLLSHIYIYMKHTRSSAITYTLQAKATTCSYSNNSLTEVAIATAHIQLQFCVLY